MDALFTSVLMTYTSPRFRWVVCQLDYLRRCVPARLQRALDDLPETLDETYEQALRGIDQRRRDDAYRLFQCLVVSRRPLRVEELAELFAIEPNAVTTPTFNSGLRPGDHEEFILSACSPLVAVVNVDRKKIVQFSHFSVREYLTSDRIATSEHVSRFHVLPRPAHALLASACLCVLLQLDYCVVWDNIRNSPLALYAAEYWVDHAQFEDASADIQYEMECLFDPKKPHFAAWLWLYNMDDSSGVLKATAHHAGPYADPLYYAALCGFRDIAEHLVDAHPQDVNARGGNYVTALHAALEKGHPNVAMSLVERGADIESRDSRSRTPLHISSYHGYTEVVLSLIGHGADPNAEGDSRKTPLYLASEEGRHDVARILLENNADANHPDVRGRTPLHLASERGHDEIVRLLLDGGADANRQDNGDRSPLHSASFEDHDEIFWSLFDEGADANHRENRGLTALHLASLWGHNSIIRSLLDHGADANLPDHCGLTPLYLASLQGHNDTVKLLPDYGANTDFPDNRGWTALHHASLHGYNETVRLLIDRGAFVNHQDNCSWTPLHHASREGHNATVQLLLDHGAVANLPDNYGWTPLHHASRGGHDATVRLLLNHHQSRSYPLRLLDSRPLIWMGVCVVGIGGASGNRFGGGPLLGLATLATEPFHKAELEGVD